MGVGSVTGPWKWLQNQEGVAYYFNSESQECVYDKPECFMTDVEKEQSTGEYVWCPHETEAFLPARILSRSGGGDLSVELLFSDGRKTTASMAAKKCVPIPSMVAASENLEDLVQLAQVVRRHSLCTWKPLSALIQISWGKGGGSVCLFEDCSATRT